MADLNVENFPEDLQQALRREAEAAGRTLSEHVVELLEEGVRARRNPFARRPQPSVLREKTAEYVVEGPGGGRHKIATAGIRNGVPVLPYREGEQPVTTEMVNRLRDELL